MTRRLVLAALCALAAGLGGTAAAKTPLPGIRSPSGNIRCLLVPGGPQLLLCSIAEARYSSVLQARCMRPDGSGVDWHGFALRPTKRGELNCTGGILYSPGTYRPRYVTLPYGRTWRRGAFTCRSRVTGVTCRNPQGHGLFVSREAWRTW